VLLLGRDIELTGLPSARLQVISPKTFSQQVHPPPGFADRPASPQQTPATRLRALTLNSVVCTRRYHIDWDQGLVEATYAYAYRYFIMASNGAHSHIRSCWAIVCSNKHDCLSLRDMDVRKISEPPRPKCVGCSTACCPRIRFDTSTWMALSMIYSVTRRYFSCD
jgi:hypothetical protein